jgi:SAM-dependent methyltransferase
LQLLRRTTEPNRPVQTTAATLHHRQLHEVKRTVDHALALINGIGFKLLPSPTGFANLPSAYELQGYHMEELVFEQQAATEYDRAFAHVTRYFMPFVLRAAHITQGMRVLDIAAGTGLSAEAALSAVGPTGHVTAADVSPAMAEKARERLSEARNASARDLGGTSGPIEVEAEYRIASGQR